ncbi:hypothetical protein DPEC_G00329240 [Dallia pectoralis]|uniref:Uncharacterized protein n=1 Tax=Dallia pectoralis TaxID=75939 RepID=A0ACC2F8M5_DALPE|nr:hypothetical protein DPEC_G00329240 [Dallia pectoralis]
MKTMLVQVVVLCLAVLGLTSALICPDGEMCEDGNTCCQTSSGGYGCCPLPNIPEGVNAIICPDGEAECPDSTTCCELPGGTWGCCPLVKAVCCEDKQHCCPEATTCDLVHSKCVSPTLGTFPMSKKLPARKIQTVDCPDKVSSCPEDTTCCLLDGGSYGCCPMPRAVCCSDHIHCCPEGMTCDLEESTCLSENGQTSMAVKFPATFTPRSPQSSVNVVACNSSVVCADGSTCCKRLEGQWACCPVPEAVCCDDHRHCCPHNTVCNLVASTCDDPTSGAALLNLLDKMAAVSVALEANDKCDESTSCPGQYTCCKTATGKWACCPLPNAVCCDDLLHCCPHGTVCNLAASTCDDPSGSSVPWVPKLPGLLRGLTGARASSVPPGKNMCDPHTSCPKGTTCCLGAKTGKWGCCPLPKAVCCSGGEHCCPRGYTCDDLKGTCTRGLVTMPWYLKERALTVGATVEDVKCDDKSSCATGTTCCQLSTGDWGCCPLVKAVCCTDHEHCCPQGYSCNMQTGTCDKKLQGLVLPMSHVTAAGAGLDVTCDVAGEYRCPRLQTCCQTSPTGWSCCPAPQAVCCMDSKHCCPVGYTCDLERGGCSQQAGLTWDKKRDFTPFGL